MTVEIPLRCLRINRGPQASNRGVQQYHCVSEQFQYFEQSTNNTHL